MPRDFFHSAIFHKQFKSKHTLLSLQNKDGNYKKFKES